MILFSDRRKTLLFTLKLFVHILKIDNQFNKTKFVIMLLACRQHLAIEVTNPKSTNPLFRIVTLYETDMLGLLRDDAVSEKKFVALSVEFNNVLRFIRNSGTFRTHEQLLCSCLVEYLRVNDSTIFNLNEEQSLDLIIDILVECEFRRRVEEYNSMLLRKHFKLAKVMYQEFTEMYERKKKDDEHLNLDVNGKIRQAMLVVHFVLNQHKSEFVPL